MTEVYVAAFVAATLLVGVGFAAFWPKFPPIDDTPMPSWSQELPVIQPRRPRRYRGGRRLNEAERLDGPEVPLPPVRVDLAGQEEDPERRPLHRWEHLGEGTQPLHWPPLP